MMKGWVGETSRFFRAMAVLRARQCKSLTLTLAIHQVNGTYRYCSSATCSRRSSVLPLPLLLCMDSRAHQPRTLS